MVQLKNNQIFKNLKNQNFFNFFEFWTIITRIYFTKFLFIFYVDLYDHGEVNDTKTGGIPWAVNLEWDWSGP